MTHSVPATRGAPPCRAVGHPQGRKTGDRLPRDNAAAVELEKRDGALMWPERFGHREISAIKAELGPYMAAGRLQQMPMPAKGGIFDRSWWQLWEGLDGKFLLFDHIIASLDSAFTAKEQNDPSALTIWGVFKTPEKRRRIVLVHAWRKHLAFSGPRIEKEPNETLQAYRQRTRPTWGLMEWVTDTCTLQGGQVADRGQSVGHFSGTGASQPLCVPSVGNPAMSGQRGQARASLGSAADLFAGDGLRARSRMGRFGDYRDVPVSRRPIFGFDRQHLAGTEILARCRTGAERRGAA